MGCSDSRVANLEEEPIIFAEEGLHFTGQDPEKIDYVIRKFSHNQLVDMRQFEQIAKMLNLNIKNYQKHTKIEGFYENMKHENRCFSMRELIALGLMLCNGNPYKVSELLLQSFDTMSEGSVSADTLRCMFQLLAKLSIKLGNLVVDHQTIHSDELKIMKYIQNLNLVMNATVNKTLERFILVNDRVSEKDFIEQFSSYLSGRLTTTAGWRMLLRDAYLNKIDIS